jgi:hypothetical protein
MSQSGQLSILHERIPKRKLSFNQKVLIGIGVVLSIPVALFALIGYAMMTALSEREIAGPTSSNAEWLEIKPNPPLKPSKESQYLVLDVANPYELEDKSWGVRLPDGTIVIPEVQLIDEYGNTFNLDQPAMFSPTSHFTQRGFWMWDLPKDRVYRAVRIRSDKPIQYSRVIWRCENHK